MKVHCGFCSFEMVKNPEMPESYVCPNCGYGVLVTEIGPLKCSVCGFSTTSLFGDAGVSRCKECHDEHMGVKR